MSTTLYPLTFHPIFKDKIWGGEKIRTILGKDFSPLPNCGESWEISGVPGNVSVVKSGQLEGQSLAELVAAHKGELVGGKVWATYGEEFPLLIKFIDAADDLSIQVHPDDTLARARHNSLGKTEMWYIFQADPGSSLIAGFNRALDKDTFLEYFQSGRIMDVLNREAVQEGDVFFLPAGRVHTIGKGLLLAEIQQTSDVTYRIYDFDRRDDKGNLRELHVEQSLDAMDYRFYPEYKTAYEPLTNVAAPLVQSAYFETNRLELTEPLHRSHSTDSFTVYICVGGMGTLTAGGMDVPLALGATVLVPAALTEVNLTPDGSLQLLESRAVA